MPTEIDESDPPLKTLTKKIPGKLGEIVKKIPLPNKVKNLVKGAVKYGVPVAVHGVNVAGFVGGIGAAQEYVKRGDYVNAALAIVSGSAGLGHTVKSVGKLGKGKVNGVGGKVKNSKSKPEIEGASKSKPEIEGGTKAHPIDSNHQTIIKDKSENLKNNNQTPSKLKPANSTLTKALPRHLQSPEITKKILNNPQTAKLFHKHGDNVIKHYGDDGVKMLSEGVIAKRATPEGHTLKVLADGKIVRCSTCHEIAQEFAKELANPQNSKLADKLKELQQKATENPEKVAEEIQQLEQQLQKTRISQLDSDAKHFENEIKEASASTRDAEAKAAEVRVNTNNVAEQLKVKKAEAKATQARAEEAKIKAEEAEAKAKKAVGTSEQKQRAEEAKKARENESKANQEAEQAKQEVVKAQDEQTKAKEELNKAKELRDSARKEETEIRQVEAMAREEASLYKQDVLTNEKSKIEGEIKVLNGKIKELNKKLLLKKEKLADRRKREGDTPELNPLRQQIENLEKIIATKKTEIAELYTQIKNLKDKIEAEIQASSAISPEIFDLLRSNSPSKELQKWVNDPSNPQVKFDPATGKPIDPVYGNPVDKLSADHIFPVNKMEQLPGFSKLTYEQQLEVVNLKENIMGIDPRVNSSKQDNLWSAYQGHSELGPIDSAVKAQLIQAEKEAIAALQKAIDERLQQ